MKPELSVLYRISHSDDIIFINNEWRHFADSNNNCGIIGNKTLYQSFWDYFDDITSEFLYRQMLLRVRGGSDANFTFRCDSADCMRILEIKVTLQPRGEVLFETRVLREEPLTARRDDDEAARKIEKLVICSWCQLIKTGNNTWRKVEKAVNILHLFELETLPQISHGICEECCQTVCEQMFD